MSRQREYDIRVARILADAGAQIIRREYDGTGHRKLILRHHGQERTFHYACTGTAYGHGIRNTQQRLKWLLEQIPPVPTEAAPAPKHKELAPSPPAVTINAPRQRLTKERRSEIVKRYANPNVTIEMIMSEFDLSHKTAETLLLATQGATRSKYERERNRKRSEAARRIHLVEQLFPPKGYDLTPKDMRRMFVLHYYGMTLREVAEMFGISVSYVHYIVKKEKQNDIR